MKREIQKPKLRGFAALPKDVLREISRKGGRFAHANGNAHEFSKEEASAAGRKGGRAPKIKANDTCA
jgi:uncharacterized protein